MRYRQSILRAIGDTPLVKLQNVTPHHIFCKAEFMNPGGSIKDRVALYMLQEAHRLGEIDDQTVIVEATSGNTGIGLAMVGRQLGYRVKLVMPDNMSEERKKIIAAFGAELVLTPAEQSLTGCLDKVRELREADPHVYVPQQFENPRNPEAHYQTTAREIWDQLDGEVHVFVAGVGSGGTLAGVGRFLKHKTLAELNPRAVVVAVEPEGHAALLGHEPGLHMIQGIGDGFVPSCLDVSLIDEVVTVTDDDAVATTRSLAREEGLLVGTSSGANVWAAQRMAERFPDRHVVTVLPDRAERYFSTALI